jgi:putative oxidoreductase
MKILSWLSGHQPISVNAIAMARIVVGVYFILHGHELFDPKAMQEFADWLKKDLGFPAPLLMAYLRTGAEFFGGIFLVLGLFTRLGAALIGITMLVATFTAGKGDVFGKAEMTVVYTVLSATIFLVGAGKFSLDHLLFSPKDHQS